MFPIFRQTPARAAGGCKTAAFAARLSRLTTSSGFLHRDTELRPQVHTDLFLRERTQRDATRKSGGPTGNMFRFSLAPPGAIIQWRKTV